MLTEWDYTKLAEAYLKRPSYAEDAFDELVARSGARFGSSACDVGAGTGRVSVALARRGLSVVAVEPNRSMAGQGIRQTAHLPHICWVEATAENTGQPSETFDVVIFGSSFNVTDRIQALRESARIMRPTGWFVCLFNYRDLRDPIQCKVQGIIEQMVPDFSHGSRREDQTTFINASRLFRLVEVFERSVRHRMRRDEYVEAWSSHCTLKRQAGERFVKVVEAIDHWLREAGLEVFEVPYRTRVWMAPRK